MTLERLASLWLHEPDDDAVERAARELGLPAAPAAELAVAYADALLMNVPPYGTAFTDPSGELNGPGADAVYAVYERTGFAPRELPEVGAPDHLGLGLLHLAAVGEDLVGLAAWGPICCRTVAELPGVHLFYRALSERTAAAIFARVPGAGLEPVEPLEPPSTEAAPEPEAAETTLSDLLRFFLAPARSGVFLTRAELGLWARALGLALPFGSRWDVARQLFTAAGEDGRLPELLARLDAALDRAAADYARWAEATPSWRPHAEVWTARVSRARALVDTMRRAADQNR